ncbi:MAG: type II toxin-antitoxin system VapC family toxin [Spirochaetales bacterium]|nr:type II toxin-antitoxin system VapC family toxin [Spirochaetales bacterium]
MNYEISDSVRNILIDEDKEKYVSTISLWEISMKYGLGKLVIKNKTPEDLYESILESGFEILKIEDRLYSTYYKLPKKEDHREPFDRMLIWQAINHDIVLLSADKKLDLYKEDGLRLA